MGVDAEMKVRYVRWLKDEELDELNRAFRERFPVNSTMTNGDDWPIISRSWHDAPEVVKVDMLDRYYGPGYERGDWTYLRDMGDWLMLRFGEEGEVRYGSDVMDTDFDSLRPWPIVRQENDEHYAKVGHLPYRPSCGCAHCHQLAGGPEAHRED